MEVDLELSSRTGRSTTNSVPSNAGVSHPSNGNGDVVSESRPQPSSSSTMDLRPNDGANVSLLLAGATNDHGENHEASSPPPPLPVSSPGSCSMHDDSHVSRRRARGTSSSTLPSLLSCVSQPSQVTAMLSNFSTSYNVVSISLTLPILQSLHNDDVTAETPSICSSSLIAGMILGQLAGGTLGDVVGRMNAMYGVMALQIVASVGSSLIRNSRGDIFVQLAVWRFVLGVGAGGVYPLAAVLSAEQEEQDRDHSPRSTTGSWSGGGGGNEATEDEYDHHSLTRKLRLIALTFSTQGIGFLSVPLLTYPLLLLLGHRNLDLVWRIVLGVGSLPGVLLVFLRYMMRRRQNERRGMERVPLDEEEPSEGLARAVETTNEEGIRQISQNEDAEHDVEVTHPEGTSHGEHEEREKARNKSNSTTSLEIATANRILHSNEQDGADGDPTDETMDTGQGGGTKKLWSSIKSEPDLFRKLLGTAGTWLLFDVLFYGNTLFQPVVLEAALGGNSKPTGDEGDVELLTITARDALILSTIALPGYFVSILVMNRTTCRVIHQTPKFIQLQGFALMSLLYAIIGSYWTRLTHIQWLLLLLYGLTFFFANYGPNTTTFMLPSVTYGPECRSTLNGISAAAGKAGALLGATMFEPAADTLGDDRVMLLCAAVSLVAFLLTRICVLLPRPTSF